MTTRDEEIGQAVARLRSKRNLTQQALADVMRQRGHKWSQATVWSIEKGERPLRLAEAVGMAEALEASFTELLQPAEGSLLEDAVLEAVNAGYALRRETQRYLSAQVRIRQLRARGVELGGESPVAPWLEATSTEPPSTWVNSASSLADVASLRRQGVEAVPKAEEGFTGDRPGAGWWTLSRDMDEPGWQVQWTGERTGESPIFKSRRAAVEWMKSFSPGAAAHFGKKRVDRVLVLPEWVIEE